MTTLTTAEHINPLREQAGISVIFATRLAKHLTVENDQRWIIGDLLVANIVITDGIEPQCKALAKYMEEDFHVEVKASYLEHVYRTAAAWPDGNGDREKASFWTLHLLNGRPDRRSVLTELIAEHGRISQRHVLGYLRSVNKPEPVARNFVTINVPLSVEIHKALKDKAKAEGIPMYVLIENALEKLVDLPEEQRR